MATTLSPPTKLNTGVWRYSWTGVAPFRVFDYSSYSYILTDTEETSIVVASNNAEPPAIEVFDSTESANIPQGERYAGHLVLQWRGYSYAEYYRVEKETSPNTYTEVQSFREDGRGYYKFTAQLLDSDIETASYRIVTVDKSGGETNTDVEQIIVRNPTPPELTYTYNAGTGLLTIAAA